MQVKPCKSKFLCQVLVSRDQNGNSFHHPRPSHRSFGEETLRGTKSQKSAKNLAESIDRSPVEAISDWPGDILIRGRSYHANFSRISAGTVWPKRVYRVTPHWSTEPKIYIYSWAWAVAAVGSRSLGREAIELQLTTIAATDVSSRPGIQWSRFYFIPRRRGINSFNNDHEKRIKFEWRAVRFSL